MAEIACLIEATRGIEERHASLDRGGTGGPCSAAMAVQAHYQGQGRSGIAVKRVASAAQRMLEAMRIGEAELSLLLCDDPTMATLNRDYRGKEGPTDVLAFALLEGTPMAARGPLLLGDVVISLPTAKRQAEERGRSMHDEVMELLAHGLLHLLGFDHVDLPQERRMRARTDLLRSTALSGS